MNYLIKSGVLTIEKPISVKESLDFVRTLSKNHINEVKLNCSINSVSVFFIKKYTKTEVSKWSP